MIVLTLVPLLLASLLPAQNPKWTKKGRAARPDARYSAAMADDAARGRVVVFGGLGSDWQTALGDTWEWDGSNWTEVTPATSPSARFSPGTMAYDSARGRSVLFGGAFGPNGQNPLGDTWEWDGTTWHEVTPALPALSPSPRRAQGMAYDSASGNVVLFGGSNGQPQGVSGDTWTWNGTSWSQHSPANSPSPRSYHAMAYDSARDRVVLFGGRDSNLNLLADTWEWDGVSWHDVTPAQSPSARRWHAIAYDEGCGCVVMFGGRDATTNFLADTWTWNGTSWSLLNPAGKKPPARMFHSLVYDSARARTLLFGGWAQSVVLSDTWQLFVP